MRNLYHYCCGHSALDLERALTVRTLADWNPAAMSLLPGYAQPLGLVSWWTDLEVPDRAGLGLTGGLSKCDRIQFRYRAVDPSGLQTYSTWARHAPRRIRDALEGAPGAMPAHWWVSTTPVLVVADPRVGG